MTDRDRDILRRLLQRAQPQPPAGALALSTAPRAALVARTDSPRRVRGRNTVPVFHLSEGPTLVKFGLGLLEQYAVESGDEPWGLITSFPACILSCGPPCECAAGPFDTAEECEAACTPSVETACCIIARVLTVTMGVFGTGSCEIVYDDEEGVWDGSGSFTPDVCGPQTIRWQMRCNGGDPTGFEIRHSCNDGANWSAWLSIAPTLPQCNPWESITSDYTLDDPGNPAGCSGCVAVEITISGSF